MAKFVIVDNSIEDTTGHHYQYAAHCLEAALKIGYKPILATNKQFEAPKEISWEIIPSYSYGFWDTDDSAFSRSLVNLNHSVSAKINRLKYKFMFSWMGFTWQNRKHIMSYSNLPGQEGPKNPIGWIILSSVLVPLFVTSVRLNSMSHKLKKTFFNLSSGKPRDPITGTQIEMKRSKIFYKDTHHLFERIKVEKGDLVFIPTVGLTELLGLLEYFKRSPDSKFASWHLLFRRNIYLGRDTGFWSQDENLRLLRNMLLNFVQSLKEEKVVFYTDTDELTSQYDRLGVSRFHTLPIPHTVSSSPTKNQPADNTPLTVTYIGDARTEKGYHLLPHIVHDMWSEYVSPGRIRFLLQSNYNIPKGEPKVIIARSELEHFPKENVELLYEPLSFDDYLKLLLGSDIVLLPYQPDNYFARSSGILVECLAAGIPVVVPSATWLSRQFIKELYRHHMRLYQNMKLVEYLTDSELSWRRHQSENNPFVNEELTFGGESTKAYCWLEKPLASSYIYISFAIKGPKRSCIKVDLNQLRYDKSSSRFSSTLVENLDGEGDTNDSQQYSVLCPLELDCYRIWLGFKNAFENKALKLNNLKIAFLESSERSASPSNRYPRGAVGLAYDNVNEISELLRDMVDNYAHYRQTALDFSKEYLEIHNATRLVEELEKSSTQAILSSETG